MVVLVLWIWDGLMEFIGGLSLMEFIGSLMEFRRGYWK